MSLWYFILIYINKKKPHECGFKFHFAFASGTISNDKSKLTSRCNRIVASYLPKRLMIFPGNVINFLSSSSPFKLIADAKSALEIDPKSLSPLPTLEASLIVSN